MYLLILGIILALMKWLEWGPVADWSWWIVLAPFALAVVWWSWADRSGYTKRKAMEREQEEVEKRRARRMEALGQKPRDRRR